MRIRWGSNPVPIISSLNSLLNEVQSGTRLPQSLLTTHQEIESVVKTNLRRSIPGGFLDSCGQKYTLYATVIKYNRLLC